MTIRTYGRVYKAHAPEAGHGRAGLGVAAVSRTQGLPNARLILATGHDAISSTLDTRCVLDSPSRCAAGLGRPLPDHPDAARTGPLVGR